MIRKALRRIFSRLPLHAQDALLPSQKGVVLVAVLWICALIMWFAFQISAATRLQGEDQIHSIRYSQALHLAIGGCYEALARIGMPRATELDHNSESDWQPDGRPHIVRYNTGSTLVIAETEDLKVNVNKAGQAQLKQVMEKAGVEETASERLADCILDFIDKDDIPRLHGAEKDAYIRAGLNYIPFNGPMTSLDQLLLIPGMTQQLFYGYTQGLDPRLEQLPDMYRGFRIPGKDSLFSLLTIYGNNVNLPQDSLSELQPEPKPLTWRPGGIYRILSFGRSANGPPTVGMLLIVNFTPVGNDPYTILCRKVL
jgi:general secretion pathway protein K